MSFNVARMITWIDSIKGMSKKCAPVKIILWQHNGSTLHIDVSVWKGIHAHALVLAHTAHRVPIGHHLPRVLALALPHALALALWKMI